MRSRIAAVGLLTVGALLLPTAAHADVTKEGTHTCSSQFVRMGVQAKAKGNVNGIVPVLFFFAEGSQQTWKTHYFRGTASSGHWQASATVALDKPWTYAYC